jgi:hypothetical protein
LRVLWTKKVSFDFSAKKRSPNPHPVWKSNWYRPGDEIFNNLKKMFFGVKSLAVATLTTFSILNNN